jgi:4-amino-4-deoxy-L-arabinose transferase-like glycosyltransferase
MNRSSILRWIAVALGVVWLFVVMLGYYVVHKPFTLENALAISSALGDALIAVAIFALGAALGRRALRAFSFASPLEAIAFRAGLGMGLISLATLALGMLGLLHPLLLWFLLLAGLFLLRADVASLWRDGRALHLPIESRFERALAIFCGVALAAGSLFALLPPTAWDAQTYHLVIGKAAMERGRIAAPLDIVYFNFPSLGEMLFLAAMVLKGDIAAQLMHLIFFALLLGALFAFASRHFNARVAWLACATLLAVPSLVSIAASAYVDLMLAFYAFAAFCAALSARESNDWRWFALAGAFAGLAMGVKYTAVIVPVALLVLISGRPSFVVRRLSFVVLFLSFAALFAAPWYLRNLLFTGNPFYPFVFGGRYWDAFRTEWFSRFGSGLVNEPLRILIAPWDATILGQEGSISYDATITPLLLALIPLLLFTWRAWRSRALRDVLIFSAMLYAFWLVGIAESKLLLQTRLLFPAFPLFALAAAVAFERLDALALSQFSLQRFARLLVLLVLALTALGYCIGVASGNALAYLVGAESRDAYLARHLGGYYAAMQFVNELPAASKVLFLWEPRSYYARRVVQPDAILDAFAHRRATLRDADSIAAALRSEGYTHILLSRGGLDYILQTGYDSITLEDAQVLQELLSRHAKPVYGKTPFEIVARENKPALRGAAEEPYAIYELSAP